jgi:hypothetical protein
LLVSFLGFSLFFSLSLLLFLDSLFLVSHCLSFEITSPFGNLWLLVDTDGISVVSKDFLELWVVEDLLS